MNRAKDGSPAPARYAVLHLLWCWYLRSNGSWPPPNVDLGKLRRLADPEYEHPYKWKEYLRDVTCPVYGATRSYGYCF